MEYQNVLEYISNMSAGEIDEVMKAIILRKQQLYTDWEIFYMAIPKYNQEECRQTIAYIREMLDREEKDGG